jgi:hypothetical protein
MSLSLSPNSLYRQTTDCTEGGGLTREHCIAIETFKIVNKTSPLYLHDLITIKQSKYSFRYQNTSHQPEQLGMVLKILNILLPRHGMSYQTTLDWNILLNNSKT